MGIVQTRRGGRMSHQSARDAVLRHLRDEDVNMASRSGSVTAATLSRWRDAFLGGGEVRLATRPVIGMKRASSRLKVGLGKTLLERELLERRSRCWRATPVP